MLHILFEACYIAFCPFFKCLSVRGNAKGKSRTREPHSWNQQSSMTQRNEGRKGVLLTPNMGVPQSMQQTLKGKLNQQPSQLKSMGEGRYPSSHREGAGQWDVCRGGWVLGGVIEGDSYNKLYLRGWKISRGDGKFLRGMEGW